MLNPGLYLVATPIGNLQDLSPRAIDVLRGALRVYAEDTRHSQKLLNHFDIQADLRSLHRHNEVSRYPEIKDLVEAGCHILSIGQYLRPSPAHTEVVEFIHPDCFAEFKVMGESLGLKHVEAGPLVRSSYLADRQAKAVGLKDSSIFYDPE